jgi:hypothetical protein
MRTTLVDGQSQGVFQNFFTARELTQVDEFVPAMAGAETDRGIAVMLNERLRRPGRELIYVVKRGAHFPFHQACPEGVVSASDPRTVQHAAAVRWVSDSFFETLADGVDFSRVLLLYTSDHGLDFERARSTHCNPSPRSAEYAVPLVTVTDAQPLASRLRAAAPKLRGRASHAAIFPTIMEAMGYPQRWTAVTYGQGLTGSPDGFLTLRSRLPFPHWSEPVVRFETTTTFPRSQPQGMALQAASGETAELATEPAAARSAE